MVTKIMVDAATGSVYAIEPFTKALIQFPIMADGSVNLDFAAMDCGEVDADALRADDALALRLHTVFGDAITAPDGTCDICGREDCEHGEMLDA